MRPRIYSCLLVIFSLLLFTGCATGPKFMKELETPNHSDEIYTALIFGRIRIHADPSVIKAFASGEYLKMHILRKDTKPTPSGAIYLNWNMEGHTSKEDAKIEKSVLLEAAPGTYNLEWIGIGFSSTSMSKFMFYTNPKNAYSEPQRLFTVKPNTLTYLGTIDITMNYWDLYPKYKYDYIMHYENNIIEDMELLKRSHPVLYEKYKGNIVQGF
ncbi:MAG: hypothetical protein ABFD82_16850 [Syntrophaceae bacterium]